MSDTVTVKTQRDDWNEFRSSDDTDGSTMNKKEFDAYMKKYYPSVDKQARDDIFHAADTIFSHSSKDGKLTKAEFDEAFRLIEGNPQEQEIPSEDDAEHTLRDRDGDGVIEVDVEISDDGHLTLLVDGEVDTNGDVDVSYGVHGLEITVNGDVSVEADVDVDVHLEGDMHTDVVFTDDVEIDGDLDIDVTIDGDSSINIDVKGDLEISGDDTFDVHYVERERGSDRQNDGSGDDGSKYPGHGNGHVHGNGNTAEGSSGTGRSDRRDREPLTESKFGHDIRPVTHSDTPMTPGVAYVDVNDSSTQFDRHGNMIVIDTLSGEYHSIRPMTPAEEQAAEDTYGPGWPELEFIGVSTKHGALYEPNVKHFIARPASLVEGAPAEADFARPNGKFYRFNSDMRTFYELPPNTGFDLYANDDPKTYGGEPRGANASR